MGRKRIDNPGYQTLASRRSRERRTAQQIEADWLRNRAWHYGIKPADIIGQWERQGRKCAGCEYPIALHGRDVAVDHDHDTGKVRGLLCRDCNYGAGYMDSLRRRGGSLLLCVLKLLRYVLRGGVYEPSQLRLAEDEA